MNANRKNEWNKILDVTQRMRELAVPNKLLADLSIDEEYAKQPWLEITQLESKRSLMLKKFFSKEPGAEESIEIADGINKIQAIDKELFLISESIKSEIGTSFSKFGDVQRAISAYSENLTHN